MDDADAVGMVGNAECGEMMTLWLKFRQEAGRRVIDRATFESFGCETAIGMAARATELLRGRTVEEALALPPSDLVGAEGPLPPIKIHCAQLVEGALRAALQPDKETAPRPASTIA
ncbi:MAG: iron-sulfur cluster assembly scaffold protein [Verrucomicrobia bacterium]|nr:iron-sulfur cluster assembly scaffold protein [Verrucomicrobiota bacterium]